MIDWVHSMGNDWGHWMRKAEAMNGAIQGTLGRCVEEGAVGAAIRAAATSKIPIVDFPEDIAEFHQAWLKIPEAHKTIIYVDYKLRIPVKEKFELMGMKKDRYYRERSKAQASMVWFLAANPIRE